MEIAYETDLRIHVLNWIEQQVLVFTSKDCFLDLKKTHQFYDLKFIIPFLQGKHHLISFLKNLTTTFKKFFKKKKKNEKKIASKIHIVYWRGWFLCYIPNPNILRGQGTWTGKSFVKRDPLKRLMSQGENRGHHCGL